MAAQFMDLDLGAGWWFYFELRIATGDIEFKNDIIDEILRQFLLDGSADVIGKQNGKKSKRVPVQRVRG